MIARIDYAAGDLEVLDMDKWAGYETERRQVLKFMADHNVANPVVLTGDIHSNWACDLRTDFEKSNAKPVGVEFTGTSISSSGDGTQKPRSHDTLLAENPFLKFYNAERGYVLCQVSPGKWQADYRVVEYVTRHGAPLVTRASFVVEDGQRSMVPA
jgi:alkaline phosphatase D